VWGRFAKTSGLAAVGRGNRLGALMGRVAWTRVDATFKTAFSECVARPPPGIGVGRLGKVMERTGVFETAGSKCVLWPWAMFALENDVGMPLLLEPEGL